ASACITSRVEQNNRRKTPRSIRRLAATRRRRAADSRGAALRLVMSNETAGVQSEGNPRTALAALFLLTYVGLGVGLWEWGPYLQREHRRLEPWKAMALWIGDATALAWFTWYCIRRKPFGLRPARTWSFALLSLLFTLGCDLAVTVALIFD